ncbi:hypothetical protein M408DRAFT_140803 [Serendipita vermifera MAFF 305830]|uniref:Cytochrome P450 n=1 Tax=Serendipita vermifera MAFF 305830 TaxID=933852 RepID=A0A0C3BAB4_SERVB|nr:hypothetical protein M408DRAFT_140803 [Serendipita vermifera MAFF 305830]
MVLGDVQKLVFSPVSLSVLAVSIVTGVYIKTRSSAASKNAHSLPPGPKPDFLIGNVRQLPTTRMNEGFCTWARTYGDMVHANIPGMRMVILNSYEVVQDVLMKRPNTTAERNNGYMFLNIMELNWFLTNLHPGPKHAEIRKMLRRAIGPQRVGHHDPSIEKSAAALMLSLHASEGSPAHVITSEVGRLVTTITYGDEIWKTMGEDMTAWNVEEMEYVNEALANFWPVDVLHFLRFIPSWVPGIRFKKIGDRSRWLSHQIRFKPFEKVQELHNRGDLGYSIATDLIEEFGTTENARDALAVLYLGGADTTSTAILAFCHALFLFPSVAKKIHDEIVTVTEGMRLPVPKDRARLPYTEAAWKESFRWKTWFPIGVPHVNTRDEIVNGFLVPTGSLIMSNNEFILMDPRVWGDPETFRPERFLEPGADHLPNPLTVIFGFGMRVCPGLYLADRIGFDFSACMAALFSLVPLEGKKVPDPNTVEYSDTGMKAPIGFECRFVPRDEKAKHLLHTMRL